MICKLFLATISVIPMKCPFIHLTFWLKSLIISFYVKGTSIKSKFLWLSTPKGHFTAVVTVTISLGFFIYIYAEVKYLGSVFSQKIKHQKEVYLFFKWLLFSGFKMADC